MKKITLFISLCMFTLMAYTQKHNTDSIVNVLKFQQDSTLRAKIHADSVKVNKAFDTKIKWAKLQGTEIFPAINAGQWSGVIPVKDPTEVPDATLEYKLLFEITSANPDSTAKDISTGLVEVARVINLHVASGIELKKIHVVIVMHGSGMYVAANNATYKDRYKTDNPNVKVINDLSALGARLIVCGQSMSYHDLKQENFLPQIKVSLTAQTVLTSYQLKGYVKNTIQE